MSGNALPESFKTQVATVGKKVTDKIKACMLTQIEAEEITDYLMYRFNEIGRYFDSKLITQAEAQEGLREVVEKANERPEQTSVSDKNTEVAESKKAATNKQFEPMTKSKGKVDNFGEDDFEFWVQDSMNLLKAALGDKFNDVKKQVILD